MPNDPQIPQVIQDQVGAHIPTSPESDPPLGRVRRALASVGSLLKAGWSNLATILLLGIFILTVVLLVRPFEAPAETNSDNVAIAWNKTMSRLGMEAVYPPQEDVFVGDIYATLTLRRGAVVPSSIDGTRTTFAGRGVKIGRVDVKEDFPRRPFELVGITPQSAAPSTKTPVPPSQARQSESSSTASSATTSNGSPAAPATSADAPLSVTLTDATPLRHVDMYVTAFPGIDIKHFEQADASWWQIATGRRVGETEEISIPQAETYSIPSVQAVLALGRFCTEEQTSSLCTDDIARKIMGYAFGSDVYIKDANGFIYDVGVSLVRQVFLTNRIVTQRYRADSLTADLVQAGSARATSSATALDTDKISEEATPIEGNVRYQDRFSSRMRLNQTFARPVVFGFRRVWFALPNSSAASGVVQ